MRRRWTSECGRLSGFETQSVAQLVLFLLGPRQDVARPARATSVPALNRNCRPSAQSRCARNYGARNPDPPHYQPGRGHGPVRAQKAPELFKKIGPPSACRVHGTGRSLQSSASQRRRTSFPSGRVGRHMLDRLVRWDPRSIFPLTEGSNQRRYPRSRKARWPRLCERHSRHCLVRRAAMAQRIPACHSASL